MSKRITALAAGLLSLAALTAATGCATAPTERVAETTAATIPAIGLLDGSNSIQRVRTSMTDPEIQQAIVNTERELRDAATEFDTTFEFERDILICEQIYVTLEPAGSPAYFDDPTATALSECINLTIAAHDQIAAE